MNYWITTHWPPRQGEDESGSTTGVWIPEGRQQAAEDLGPGDLVAVYQTKYGRTAIYDLPDGQRQRVDCTLGREGIICYGTADSGISAIPDSGPEKYADGTEIWWRWHASVSVLSRTGFVPRQDLLGILGYRPNYNLRGFGEYHSGLKKVTQEQFDALVRRFQASRPIELPLHGGPYTHDSPGTQEGPIHRKLKNYVMENPAAALHEPGLQSLKVEYRLPTNDRVDVVLADQHNRIVGVEIETSVEDLQLAGPLQAIKYRYMLECFTGREPGDSRAILVAHEIGEHTKVICDRYQIEWHEIPHEAVDSWTQGGHQ